MQDGETATAALRRLAPTSDTSESAHAAAFGAIAALLLDGATLRIAGQPYRFTELEIYYQGHTHLDPYTHGDAMQKQLGRWYFHRAGARYKAGTYKGLDIAFGNDAAFGGILIRGLERHGGALLDGPCVVVDHILATAGATTIDELVTRFDVTVERTPQSPLFIELGPAVKRAIYATPRVGLTLKRHAELGRRFLARPYRFLSEPARIRKGKPHLITALHQQGQSAAQIAALTGTRPSVVDEYLHAYDAGRSRAIDTFPTDLNPRELCALLGACAADGS